MKRKSLFGFLILFWSVFLSGCDPILEAIYGGDVPQKLYEKVKYTEAYPLFVARAGKEEILMKSGEKTFALDTPPGVSALRDYYYAAKCAERLGKTQEAVLYYKRVIYIGNYESNLNSMHPLEKIKKEFAKLNKYIRDSLDSNLILYMKKSDDFEGFLNSSQNDLVPQIDVIRAEYRNVSKAFNDYIAYHGLRNPKPNTKENLSDAAAKFTNLLSGIQPPDSVSNLPDSEQKMVAEASYKLGPRGLPQLTRREIIDLNNPGSRTVIIEIQSEPDPLPPPSCSDPDSSVSDGIKVNTGSKNPFSE